MENNILGPLVLCGKLVLAHCIISVVAILLIGVLGDDIVFLNAIVNLLLFLVSLSLYFLSGYLFTRNKTKWYYYFPVTMIGIVWWLACYSLSPDSVDYKTNVNAGNWFYYEIYIMVKTPLHFIDFLYEHNSLKKDLIIKFTIPLIISLAQFAGGIAKYRRLKKEL